MKDVHQRMAQCLGNIGSDVDTSLIQNDQRNNVQEGLFGGLCATLTILNAKLDKNTQDTEQMVRKFVATHQRMGK